MKPAGQPYDNTTFQSRKATSNIIGKTKSSDNCFNNKNKESKK